jgi:hypothetical protein
MTSIPLDANTLEAIANGIAPFLPAELQGDVGPTGADGATGPAGSSAGGRGVNVMDYGAVGDYDLVTGIGADDTAAIMAAINSGAKNIYFPEDKVFQITQTLPLLSGVSYIGGGRRNTTVTFTAATGNAFANIDNVGPSNTKADAQIQGMTVTNRISPWDVIYARNCQWFKMRDFWIRGSGVAGQTAIRLDVATFAQGEATYYDISDGYIGCYNGLTIGDGANSGSIQKVRIQPMASGRGIVLTGTQAGYVSNVTLDRVSVETPNTGVIGIFVAQNVHGLTISNGRFEHPGVGIQIGTSGMAAAAKPKHVTLFGNYRSGATIDVAGADTATLTNLQK